MPHPDQAIAPAAVDLDTTLRNACALRGVSADGARLLHHSSNAVFHLPAADLVARLTPGDDVGDRLRATQCITRWLATEQGFPATRPADIGPVEDKAATVTFWRYYPQPSPAPDPSSADLAGLLRRLHHINQAPPATLDTWVPLASLDTALHDRTINAPLTSDERRWLLDEVNRVRDDCYNLDYPLDQGLIHGDAWAGNLLRGHDGYLLGDWDWLAWGPREIDLIPTWHAATRYGRGAAWSAAFATEYGYDLSNWPGFASLLHMRDLVQLTGPLRRAATSERHRRMLRQRFDAIRAGDPTPWTAFQPGADTT
ncbi:aminoglycoside phosphotransferase [Actinocatenispora thailandica]|uniref:Aminoglycoside phosphotransferase n=1 Tax=Actinocatenispora thailandica TaxID=227318 RepID=A0A7R7DRB2_9ACTN|nr:aminoglycoside phosphotransferase family protein [Actinocatenispora thailandica]BCJ36359.1 aminoglycoside phosphotransferase [Actinocatenispora thailandica]